VFPGEFPDSLAVPESHRVGAVKLLRGAWEGTYTAAALRSYKPTA